MKLRQRLAREDFPGQNSGSFGKGNIFCEGEEKGNCFKPHLNDDLFGAAPFVGAEVDAGKEEIFDGGGVGIFPRASRRWRRNALSREASSSSMIRGVCLPNRLSATFAMQRAADRLTKTDS